MSQLQDDWKQVEANTEDGYKVELEHSSSREMFKVTVTDENTGQSLNKYFSQISKDEPRYSEPDAQDRIYFEEGLIFEGYVECMIEELENPAP